MGALLILAALGTVLILVIAGPFIPGLTWALAFAVVADPVHRWVRGRVHNPNLAAGLSVFVVTLALLLPTVLIGQKVIREAAEASTQVQARIESGEWRQQLQQNPRIARAWYWIEENVDVRQEAKNIAEAIQQLAQRSVRSVVWGITQILIALFALFYFFRDRNDVLKAIRSFMPTSRNETDYLFERIQAVTRATIHGKLAVSAIQGALGGTMFWVLQIPGALLWGVVMGVVSIIPVLGAFLIWLPVAAYLAVQGNWGKALILTVWGAVVVGSIDNFLYPVLTGKEVRLHTLPVFIALVGGLFIFGAVGLVLGPVVLAGTIAIFDILRRRTSHGRSAEEPT